MNESEGNVKIWEVAWVPLLTHLAFSESLIAGARRFDLGGG